MTPKKPLKVVSNFDTHGRFSFIHEHVYYAIGMKYETRIESPTKIETLFDSLSPSAEGEREVGLTC